MNKATKEVLIKLYIDEQKSMHRIADELGVSITTIFNYLKKYGIETRSKKDTFTFKGKKQSEEVIDIIRRTHKGKVLSKDTKEKISKSHKGVNRTNNKWNAHVKNREDGYIQVYKPEHPYANKDGYVMEHRLVMEEVLERYIKENEVIHHINRNRKDNRPENLMIFSSISDHMRYHGYFRKKEKKQ